VEFTGYVTRVRLLVESTGAEILYKVRSHDCVSQPLQEGQVVTLNWSTDDCVFLPH
jgi:putative spermidine/putrescine transport system ATP-binding protein